MSVSGQRNLLQTFLKSCFASLENVQYFLKFNNLNMMPSSEAIETKFYSWFYPQNTEKLLKTWKSVKFWIGRGLATLDISNTVYYFSLIWASEWNFLILAPMIFHENVEKISNFMKVGQIFSSSRSKKTSYYFELQNSNHLDYI